MTQLKLIFGKEFSKRKSMRKNLRNSKKKRRFYLRKKLTKVKMDSNGKEFFGQADNSYFIKPIREMKSRFIKKQILV